MNRPAVVTALAALAGLLTIAAAADPTERLRDPAQEARARAVFQQVRCVVCQNESIDDSEAELAADLRRFVRDRIAAGQSPAQVRQALVARYGDFILLKPRFSAGTAVLWLTPLAIVVGGGAGLALSSRRRSRGESALLTPDEAAALDVLAAENPD